MVNSAMEQWLLLVRLSIQRTIFHLELNPDLILTLQKHQLWVLVNTMIQTNGISVLITLNFSIFKRMLQEIINHQIILLTKDHNQQIINHSILRIMHLIKLSHQQKYLALLRWLVQVHLSFKLLQNEDHNEIWKIRYYVGISLRIKIIIF